MSLFFPSFSRIASGRSAAEGRQRGPGQQTAVGAFRLRQTVLVPWCGVTASSSMKPGCRCLHMPTVKRPSHDLTSWVSIGDHLTRY